MRFGQSRAAVRSCAATSCSQSRHQESCATADAANVALVCCRRGTVTISPSPVFTLFANSSAQQYADAHLTAAQVSRRVWPQSATAPSGVF